MLQRGPERGWGREEEGSRAREPALLHVATLLRIRAERVAVVITAAAASGALGGELGEAVEAAGGPDWRRGRAEGPAAAEAPSEARTLALSARSSSSDGRKPDWLDCSREAVAALAASVRREGWPNGAGEA